MLPRPGSTYTQISLRFVTYYFSAAEDDPNCSIYGMPVLRVWKSENVFVLKRSIGNAGYTGMQNPVLFKDNTHVLLGDAKDTCEELRTEICKN